MRVRSMIAGSILAVLAAVTCSQAQSVAPFLSEARAEPKSVRPGDKVLISCRVTHPDGPGSIQKAAATVFEKERIRVYPTLYDDGTHGDKTAGDGVYSLMIRVSEVSWEPRVVFHAVSKDRVEVDSEACSFRVK